MRNVRFEPWKGDVYEHAGLFGKRVLVLGESHYDWDVNKPLTAQITRQCINEQLEGTWSMRFGTNIVITFLNKTPSLEDKRTFWHSVAFYNYVQTSVGFGPRVRPSPEMWQQSLPAFLDVLGDLRPQFILVLGRALWEHLPEFGSRGPDVPVQGKRKHGYIRSATTTAPPSLMALRIPPRATTVATGTLSSRRPSPLRNSPTASGLTRRCSGPAHERRVLDRAPVGAGR